ncbi:MAG: hypothetical protein J2P41_22050, partial [Blastocatellia bacterium]|nr:hypothetical protein [Blastocatellia bacterium]
MFNSIRKLLLPAFLLSFLSACYFLTGEGEKLLFAYNLSDSDGLRLAYSEDGFKWTPLKNGEPFYKSQIGSKLMHAPSLIESQRGEFHLLWSSGEADKGFGYAKSSNLIEWSGQRMIPISERLKAYNTRSPFLYYERKPRLFHIVWSATVPGLREEKLEEGATSNLLLSMETRDFANFGEPKVFFDPQYHCPDGALIQVGDKFKVVFVDGRPDQGKLRISSVVDLHDKWDE